MYSIWSKVTNYLSSFFIRNFFTLTQVTIQTIAFTWVQFLSTLPTSGLKKL